jgi:two-component system response regulator DevR
MSATSGGYLNVYVLDDHDLVRQGLRDLLAPARDLRVVGDSGKVQGAAELILRLHTHVMVLDLHLQDGSGVQVCRQVRAVDPSVHGILVTSADDDDALAAAVLAGAAGFVVKLARSSDVMGAIRKLRAGERLMDAVLADRAASTLRVRARGLLPKPSEAELALLDQLLAGSTDRELAENRGRPLAEVQTEVATLIDRLLTSPDATARVLGAVPTAGKHRRAI